VKKVNKSENLEQRVFNFIQQNKLIEGGKLLVAVSGGPDSICLLHILYSLREKLGIELHVVHLNHKLRGEESKADALYVKEIAKLLGLSFTIGARDASLHQKKHHLSLEEAAREVRYSFFAEVARKFSVDSVAVGHTQDDHVETILMHLIRGSGIYGLTGLLPLSHLHIGKHNLEVVRPLLNMSREETQAYCRKYDLAPRMDSSNISPSHLRNRIRMQLVPLLKTYNPNITDSLLRTSSIASEWHDFLDSAGNIAWENVIRLEKDAVVISKGKFLNLHPALQRHLLRKAIATIRAGTANPLKDIEAIHIQEIMSLLNKPAGKIIHLPYNLIFSVEYDKYLLSTDLATLSPFPKFNGETNLNVPGNTKFNHWSVKADLTTPEQIKKSGDFTAYLDFDKVGSSLTVRNHQAGDRFQPLGMNRLKKLGEFMIDARIPHAWRRDIPIVHSTNQIIWLVGYRIDERMKVTSGTKRVLKISFKALD
jgi:tRNA(Ile)-lysidine synthase